MRALGVGLAMVLALGVTGCSTDPNSIAAQANSGDGKGYVSGDGTIEKIETGQRSDPLTVSGTTLEGKAWSLADAQGKVVVLNVWGSWCAPCVAESADLQKVWSDLSVAGKPVQFMGLNYRDPSPATALAFQRAKKVTYPSLRDDGGRTLLGLRGKAASTPTTLVLDRQGRIASRVSGPVSAATLADLVADVLGENA